MDYESLSDIEKEIVDKLREFKSYSEFRELNWRDWSRLNVKYPHLLAVAWTKRKLDSGNKKSNILYIANNPTLSLDKSLKKALQRYTAKNESSYDEAFDIKIRKLRPDWFRPVYNIDAIKLEFLEMAKRGDDKSKNKQLYHICKKYPEFKAQLQNISPSWFKSIYKAEDLIKRINETYNLKLTVELDVIEFISSKFNNINHLMKEDNALGAHLYRYHKDILDSSFPEKQIQITISNEEKKEKIEDFISKNKRMPIMGGDIEERRILIYIKALRREDKIFKKEFDTKYNMIRPTQTPEQAKESFLSQKPDFVIFPDQEWLGMKYKYRFIDTIYGEYYQTTGNAMKSWKRGNSGHPDRIQKKIKCSNGQIYKNSEIAAKELGLFSTSIHQVCKRKSKHTGGYSFFYCDEEGNKIE